MILELLKLYMMCCRLAALCQPPHQLPLPVHLIPLGWPLRPTIGGPLLPDILIMCSRRWRSILTFTPTSCTTFRAVPSSPSPFPLRVRDSQTISTSTSTLAHGPLITVATLLRQSRLITVHTCHAAQPPMPQPLFTFLWTSRESMTQQWMIRRINPSMTQSQRLQSSRSLRVKLAQVCMEGIAD